MAKRGHATERSGNNDVTFYKERGLKIQISEILEKKKCRPFFTSHLEAYSRVKCGVKKQEDVTKCGPIFFTYKHKMLPKNTYPFSTIVQLEL